MNVLSLREVKAVDRDGLWRAYMNWPGSIRRALSQPIEVPEWRSFDSVVLGGMGGSGSACDILSDWLRPRVRIPVSVVKDYRLPEYVGGGTLVVLMSLGGRTKETRNALRQSVEKGCAVAVVSSGGIIEGMSRDLKVSFNRVESLLVPRASVPGMVVVGARILGKLGIVDSMADLLAAAEEVEDSLSRVAPSVPFGRNPSKKLAKELRGKRVVVYSPEATASVAVHFKNSMNENAKVPVQVESYPELFHNEIETWVAAANRTVILLRVSDLEVDTAAEVENTKRLLRRFKVPFTELREATLDVSTYFKWSLTLDLASVYLAVLEKIPPAPTPILSQMKKD